MDAGGSIILVLIGIVVGAGGAYALSRRKINATKDQLQQSKNELDRKDAVVQTIQDQLEEERRTRRELQQKMEQAIAERARLETRLQQETSDRETFARHVKDTFAALSREALSKNKQDFIQLAEERFMRLREDSKADLAQRQQAVESMVRPIREVLDQTRKKIEETEQQRTRTYGAIDQQLKRMAQDQNRLTVETGKLVSALHRPQVRGRYGEIQLRRVVELAGMAPYCDFQEQYSVTSEEGRILRPDMIVRMPNDRTLIIDAKMPMEHYLRAIETDDEHERETLMGKHATSVRQHVNALELKSYWDQFDKTPDFVVMFIGGEQFLTAALEYDRELLDRALGKKVILTTPASLMGLLLVVAYGWRQEDIARNAREIEELGKTLYDRIAIFAGHFDKVGKSLRSSVENYNKAAGSMEHKLISAARKFTKHGIQSSKDLPEIDEIDATTRSAVQLPADSRKSDADDDASSRD